MANIIHGANGTSRNQWILPPEIGKTREVSVGCAQGEAVLDGQRSEVRVGHQVRADSMSAEQCAQHLGMSRCGLRNPNVIARYPILNVPPGAGHGLRRIKDSRICHQPNEAEQTLPWHTDSVRAIEATVKPTVGRLMFWAERTDARVEQDIDIDKDHL